jgi:hypothetical protein
LQALQLFSFSWAEERKKKKKKKRSSTRRRRLKKSLLVAQVLTTEMNRWEATVMEMEDLWARDWAPFRA